MVASGGQAGPAGIGRIDRVLAYDAPFLIEKLINDRIVDSEAEGLILFRELKRYFVMSQQDKSVGWAMYSHRIDAVWHEFILFTDAYIDFCERFFGEYIGHSPAEALTKKAAGSAVLASFRDFTNRYHALFGCALPDVWYDEKSITSRRRIFNDAAGTWIVRDRNGLIELLSPGGRVLLSAAVEARDALAFIAQTEVFYVRELPGDLTDGTAIGIVAALVRDKLLRVGS